MTCKRVVCIHTARPYRTRTLHPRSTHKNSIYYSLSPPHRTHTARPRTDRAQLPTWLALALDASSRSYHTIQINRECITA